MTGRVSDNTFSSWELTSSSRLLPVLPIFELVSSKCYFHVLSRRRNAGDRICWCEKLFLVYTSHTWPARRYVHLARVLIWFHRYSLMLRQVPTNKCRLLRVVLTLHLPSLLTMIAQCHNLSICLDVHVVTAWTLKGGCIWNLITTYNW